MAGTTTDSLLSARQNGWRRQRRPLGCRASLLPAVCSCCWLTVCSSCWLCVCQHAEARPFQQQKKPLHKLVCMHATPFAHVCQAPTSVSAPGAHAGLPMPCRSCETHASASCRLQRMLIHAGQTCPPSIIARWRCSVPAPAAPRAAAAAAGAAAPQSRSPQTRTGCWAARDRESARQQAARECVCACDSGAAAGQCRTRMESTPLLMHMHASGRGQSATGPAPHLCAQHLARELFQNGRIGLRDGQRLLVLAGHGKWWSGRMVRSAAALQSTCALRLLSLPESSWVLSVKVHRICWPVSRHSTCWLLSARSLPLDSRYSPSSNPHYPRTPRLVRATSSLPQITRHTLDSSSHRCRPRRPPDRCCRRPCRTPPVPPPTQAA